MRGERQRPSPGGAAGFGCGSGKLSREMPTRGLSDELLDLVFPPRCQVCDALGSDVFCATCREDAEFIGAHACLYCGAPLPPAAPAEALCADCREGRWFSGARAAGLHAGALRRAIIRYKYHGRTRLAAPLGAMLAEVLLAEDERRGLPLGQCAALVPVPLHRDRRAWRGFDQAEMLCDSMAEATGLPMWPDVIARVRNTTPQVSLQGASRLENVRGAFEARRRWKLRGRAVIVVDAVMTTGATINESAPALRTDGDARDAGLAPGRAAERRR